MSLRILSELSTYRLLSAISLKTAFGARDHALIRLALQTGLRVSELTGLDVGLVWGVQGPRQWLDLPHAIAKNHKSRSIPLVRRRPPGRHRPGRLSQDARIPVPSRLPAAARPAPPPTARARSAAPGAKIPRSRRPRRARHTPFPAPQLGLSTGSGRLSTSRAADGRPQTLIGSGLLQATHYWRFRCLILQALASSLLVWSTAKM